MESGTAKRQGLKAQAAALLVSLGDASPMVLRAAELDALIHDAEAKEHRRAAFLARDAACYRLGAAFEPFGGLNLDPVTLTGWLALSSDGVLLLARRASAMPTASIVEQLNGLFRSPAGREIRALGVWTRWHWIKALYDSEVAAFRATEAGKHPERWLAKPTTAKQRYLISELCTLLQKEPQSFQTRASAYEWIDRQGGNARFQVEPRRPSMADIEAALR